MRFEEKLDMGKNIFPSKTLIFKVTTWVFKILRQKLLKVSCNFWMDSEI